MKPAIIVAEHYAGMGIVYGLGIKGVPVVVVAYDDVEIDASKYVQSTVRVPHPKNNEEGFVAGLVALADQYEGSLLIPATDRSLVVLAQHKAQLSQHFVVACPGWDIIKLIIDKSYTYKLGDEIGIGTPKTFDINSIEDAEVYGREVDYPCLIKPRQSHVFDAAFNSKMFSVTNFDELMTQYQRVDKIGIEVMIQEFILGDDSAGVNYNSYIGDGFEPIEFTARKVRNAPPQFGSPRCVISEDVPEIIEPSLKLLQAIGYQGFSCTEFKKDARDGIYKLMEVNGRHNLSAMLAVRCGLNFPWIEYAHLMLGESPTPADFRKNVYWINVASDLKQSIKHRRTEKYSLRDYIRPYIKPHVFALLDWRDPKPFIKRISAGFRKKHSGDLN